MPNRPMTREPIEALRTILKEVWGCEMELSFPRIGNALNAVSDEIDRLKAREEALEPLVDEVASAKEYIEGVEAQLREANAALQSAPRVTDAPALPADVAALVGFIEPILFRRLMNHDLDGYTLETAREIAAALSARRVGVGVEDVARMIAPEDWRRFDSLRGNDPPESWVDTNLSLIKARAILALGQPEITVQQEDHMGERSRWLDSRAERNLFHLVSHICWTAQKAEREDEQVNVTGDMEALREFIDGRVAAVLNAPVTAQQALDTLRAHCKDMKGYWTDHIGLLDAEYPRKERV